MNRRSFFKVIAAVGASTALPIGALKLIPEAEAIPTGFASVGLIRELGQYIFDTGGPYYVVRWDVLAGPGTEGRLSSKEDFQYHMDTRWASEDEFKLKAEEYRGIARDLLDNALKERGFTWNDVRKMEIPDSISHGQRI